MYVNMAERPGRIIVKRIIDVAKGGWPLREQHRRAAHTRVSVRRHLRATGFPRSMRRNARRSCYPNKQHGGSTKRANSNGAIKRVNSCEGTCSCNQRVRAMHECQCDMAPSTSAVFTRYEPCQERRALRDFPRCFPPRLLDEDPQIFADHLLQVLDRSCMRQLEDHHPSHRRVHL